MSKYQEFDMDSIKPISIKKRESKVKIDEMASPFLSGSSFVSFLKTLPKVLAAKDFHVLVSRIVQAVHDGKPVLAMLGAHVIKVGLSPVIVDLLENEIIHGIALNGAGAIHDVELAYFGTTSEDVSTSLKAGRFGMAKETADILNLTIQNGKTEKLGFGEALGKQIVQDNPPYHGLSVLGQAYRLGVPVTVHVAVGTDIVHQHPSADGCSIGEASLRDFRIWTHLVSRIGNGGVVLLFGSSVILPEVFLKALTVVRNRCGRVTHFTTANFDMIRHYRPTVNFIERPNLEGGQGYQLIGQHEIMMPLLAAAVKEGLDSS